MGNGLDDIITLIYELLNLKEKIYCMCKPKYICEYWDVFDQDITDCTNRLEMLKQELVNACNDYIDYPVKKFLFYDYTSKVSYDDERCVLKIPYIHKKEYYCLRSKLDSSQDIVTHLYGEEYFLHKTIIKERS